MSLSRLLLFLMLIIAGSGASAQQFPELSGRVVDEGNLLTPQQEVELTGKLEALEQASSRQLVVATIADLQGYPIEDYGYQLGRHWGIGQSEANNGTILLVAPKERRVRIEVGYGLEPILTDAFSNRVIDETIIPHFKAGDMGGGIVAGADALIEQLQAPPEVAEQRALEAAAQQRARSADRGSGGSVFPLIFWGIVLAGILFSMIGNRRRFGRYRGRRYGGSAWPILLWTVANEIERGSRGRGSGPWGGGGFGGWGGGGFGGGGGGGFGGFSGGGGSFGGGGASGSW